MNLTPAPPTIRREGKAELVGDIVHSCIGGVAGQVATTTITVQTSLPLATRTLGGGYSEPLLLIDEPGAGNLRSCAAGLSGCNAWHGRKTSANTIVFNGVALTQPGSAAPPRVIRIANLRVDPSQFESQPNAVTAYVSARNFSFGFNEPSVTVAIVQRGLTVSAAPAADLRLCQATNAGLASNPAVDADTAAQFTVTLGEGFRNAFRAKNIAQTADLYPPDLNQRAPGMVYNTETGFFNGAPPDAFPAADQLDRAGAADQGTRVFIRFANVPGGMKLFAPARVGGAALTQASGPFAPVNANAAGLAPVPASGSDAIAVYEIVAANPAQIEQLQIPITVAYASAIAGAMPAVSAGFGPADSTSFPRFDAAQAIVLPSLRGVACGQAFPVLTFSGSTFIARNTTGSVSLGVRNAGDAAGPVTVQFAIPAGFAASPTGAGWTCGPASCTSALAAGSTAQPISVALTPGPSAQDRATLTAAAGASADAWNLETAAFQTHTVETSNLALVFSVDGTLYNATQRFTWAAGSTHAIGVDSPQRVAANRFVFQRWSNAGPQYQTVTAAGSTIHTAAFGPASSSMQCALNAGVAPLIRRSGLAELAGELLLYCAGGTPTPAGSPVPKVDLRVAANAAIASRVTFPGYSEALLLIDEPHSGTNPGVPLLPCGAPTAGDDGQGSCSINAAGAATYNGTAGRPNVFQGQIDGDAIVFRGVPLEPPAEGGIRTLRLLNLRLRAAALPPSEVPFLRQAKVSLQFTPSGVALDSRESSIAYAQDSDVVSSASSPVNLAVCDAVNTAAVVAQFAVTVAEDYPSAFSVRNAGYPQLLSQNVAGAVYNSESGFYAGVSAQAPVQLISGVTPTLTAPFPSLRGLNIAGLADSGTRFFVEYSNIPAGVKLYVRASNASAALVSPSAAANASGFVEAPVSAGKATAIYEAVAADPFRLETVTFSSAVAFAANAVSPATIQVAVGLAPVEGSSIPRFAANGFTEPAFNLQGCTASGPVDAGISLRRNAAFASTDRNYTITVANYLGTVSGTTTVSASLPSGSTFGALGGSGWTCAFASCSRTDSLNAGAAFPPITLSASSVAGTASVTLTADRDSTAFNNTAIDQDIPARGPYQYVPVTPCRIADTRNAAGPFGAPALGGQAARDFVIPSSACGIPSHATAYALNVTVVPRGPLGYVSVWPTGNIQPVVSTLNSLDGRVKANAALVPAGLGGSISVFATDATELVLDINGYFAPPVAQSTLQFYPLAPCRILDTRSGAPLGQGATRTVTALASVCAIPAAARAYSLNATVVPNGPFGYLTLWPTGATQPLVSTLNGVTGTITANAAIVPAGSNGSVDVFASNAAHLILDVNGYFAPPGSGGTSFYTLQPTRILDTRVAPGQPLPASGFQQVGRPAGDSPAAYSLSATAVLSAPLGYLTLWPAGQPRPAVSTLNAVDGALTSNAAIVVAGTGFGIQAFVSDSAHLLLDINGYFQP